MNLRISSSVRCTVHAKAKSSPEIAQARMRGAQAEPESALAMNAEGMEIEKPVNNAAFLLEP
jgi:hypothetical protein